MVRNTIHHHCQRRMASLRAVGNAGRREIETVCGYFAKHAERMHYDKYLAAGYPIATGVIEGACRHLVKDRMERSGMRWTATGAQAMLNLRALEQTSYWDEFQQTRIASRIESLKPYRRLIQFIASLAGLRGLTVAPSSTGRNGKSRPRNSLIPRRRSREPTRPRFKSCSPRTSGRIGSAKGVWLRCLRAGRS